MAKCKQRRRKPRASVRFRFKKQESIPLPQCSSILPSKLPDSDLNQSRPFCSWSLTLPNIKKVVRPLVTTVLCWYCWCQNSVIQFPQFFRVIKNAVFQSPASLQELNALRERLEKLETEFAALQSMVQMGTVVPLEKTSCQTLEDGQCQRSTPAPLHLDASLKTDVPMQITLKDLLSVKLKKTRSCLKIEKGSPLQKRRALITISDLQSISLNSKAAMPPNCAANSPSTPSGSCIDLRKHLRRVSVKRSPGGTPLVHRENLETGTGLTPLMTQALRRKFQARHPKLS
ncbi:UNVERIFIED_CONTAM: hypothetical protein K2H54_033721 [Gekko kuhli]